MRYVSLPVRSAKSAASTVRETPLLLLITAVTYSLAILIATPLSFLPLVGSLASQIMIGLATGGIVGAIALGVTDKTDDGIRFGGVTKTVRTYWKSLAGAYTLATFIYAAVLVVLLIVGVVLFKLFPALSLPSFTGSPQYDLEGGTTAVIIVGVYLTFCGTVFATLAMIFQFINTAIVISGQSATESIRTSYRIVRDNMKSVLGYSLLRVGVVLVPSALLLTIVGAVSFAAPDVAIMLYILGLLIFWPIMLSILYAFHTHYYLGLCQTRGAPGQV